mmetsp:Transcript_11833/g.20574  ORF Transcript_11833/g.20574 Transcript_11833/m.20574 type:complete len:269 (-) Transcript_11833:90-896(-)
MISPAKTPERRCRGAKEHPLTAPVRRSARSATRKKSPYKTPVKASKLTAKKAIRAKTLSPIRKFPSKQDKMRAKARAQEWARNELGLKLSPVQIIVIDDEEVKNENELKEKTGHVAKKILFDGDEEERDESKAQFGVGKKANHDRCTLSCLNCDHLYQRMLELDVENQKLKKKADANDALAGSRKNGDINKEPNKKTAKEDIFYDALEFLPKGHDDIAVEDVSDEEDDCEIRDLRSVQRNRVPSRGQWMEPLEPVGVSYSTFLPQQKP